MSEPSLYIVTVEGPEWINANDRRHWARKAKLTRRWREAAAWAAKSSIAPRPRGCDCCVPPVFERIQVTAVCLFPDARRRDPHNLTLTAKACIDGLVDVGVIRDDSTRYLDGPDMRARIQRTPLPTLELHITPMDGGTS